MKRKILEFLSLFIAYNFFNFYTMLTIVESTSSTFYTIDNKFLISLASMVLGNYSALTVGFIIFISIYYVLKYLTGKPFLCGTIEIVLLYVLATISFVKMKILGIPLFVSDVKFLNGMEDITGLVSVSEIPEIIGIYGLALILLSSISILILKFCSEKKKKSWKVSLVYLLVLVIVFNPTVFKFFVSEPEIYIKNYYSKCGLVPFLYREFLYEQVEEPKGFSEEKVEENFEVETEKAENWGKPNVVFLLAETFWNAEKIEEVEFDKDFLAGYKNVQQYGKTIDMISPAFAGMTTNVEFEILGGYPIRNFVEGYIAYNVLYGTEQAAVLPSLVNDFNNGGYKSIIYSPFDEGEVYNVKNVYKYLGFNEINLKSDVFTEDRRKGKFISDEYMYSLIPERIKNTEEPVFLFMKTVQNHMPYADKYEEEDMSISVVKSELDEEKTKLVRNYVQGVYDTSIEFEKLYNEIQQLEEPTVVIFFGDHLPSLITADGKNAFLDFKWFNKDEEGHNNLFEQHHTQTVIISNYDIQMQDIKSLGFDMLGSFVLNHIDIEESPYFAFKNSRFEDYIAGYGGVYLDKNNNLLTENDLSKEQLDFMEDLKENWYYFFKDSK